MKELNGGCLCGAVEYSIPDDFKYAGYCHCSECRRFSGSLFSAFGGIPKAGFTVLKGADHIRHYPETENTIPGFCGICGSSLCADKPKSVRLRTLSEAPSVGITRRVATYASVSAAH